MKRTIAWVLVALAAACSQEEERRPLAYGAPAAATYEERAAAEDAEYTLSQAVAYGQPADPALGAPGLVDQLVAELGYSTGLAAEPGLGALAKGAAAAHAIVPLDPCTTVTATSVTWTDCVETESTVDPDTGASWSMTITIDGSVSWDPDAGTTTWGIHQTVGMSQSEQGFSMQVTAAADSNGSMTVTGSTIALAAESRMAATTILAGMRFDERVVNTAAADLDYVTDPAFCITGGTLTVEQRWEERPMGSTAAQLPDQGWRFDWTGCGLFTVAHGS
jgi:hypothetical protein